MRWQRTNLYTIQEYFVEKDAHFTPVTRETKTLEIAVVVHTATNLKSSVTVRSMIKCHLSTELK